MAETLTGTRDHSGLTVRDAHGNVVAFTASEDEAGLFVGEEGPWLASQGLRRVGPVIAKHRDYDRGWPYDVPPTHSEFGVERVDA